MRPEFARLAAVELHPAKREELRRKTYEREGGKCFWCGGRVRLTWKRQWTGRETPEDAATLDHIIPKSQGGKYDINNLVCACRSCNAKRGSADAQEFLRTVAARPTDPG